MAVGGNARTKFEDLSEPPWYRWREKDPAERCIRFVELYCRSPKGEGHNRPIRLAEFQKAWIRKIFKPGIREAVLQAPRGQGKSTLLAAIAVWAVFDRNPTGQPIVPICATTVGQAVRSVYGVVTKMIAKEPELSKRSIVHTAFSTAMVLVGYNDGECFPIANDTETLKGLDFTVFIMDEVADQPFEAWNDASGAGGKRSQSLMVGIGTPSPKKDDSALWELRQNHLEGNASEAFSFTELSAPDDCDITDEAMWRLANPAIDEGYLGIDALRNDVRNKPESWFRTYRLSQWVEGTDCWLGVDGRRVWRDLKSDYKMVDGADTYVGVDIGQEHDTTAVVIGQKTPDGKLHTTARIWKPTDDMSVDVSATMQHIRDLDEKYHLVKVVFDPRLFEFPAALLAAEGLPMEPFPQSIARTVPATGNLYEAIMRKEISHDGAADYERQILNAMLLYVDDGFRLAKRKSRGHIDSAIALMMAHDLYLHPPPPVYPLVCLIAGG
ncbi:hypothetical protein BayCH28_22295 [Mycolicibacterium sp. CH28]|uniref:terminase TerL endonuclease subunit n=1 Tax=Mycolicibacterium sp. CH28 TaxID=2512237 RepID=UPI0010815540|nr:terminase TerL endonuclease subunit [Mycolicibacterium sp. CH28]TGD85135.1 hypothetical protein BayCH28_22295 [Mycolicibacterium sp. CH28]